MTLKMEMFKNEDRSPSIASRLNLDDKGHILLEIFCNMMKI